MQPVTDHARLMWGKLPEGVREVLHAAYVGAWIGGGTGAATALMRKVGAPTQADPTRPAPSGGYTAAEHARRQGRYHANGHSHYRAHR